MEVGEAAYGSFDGYGRYDVRKGVVVKITPSGQVSVDFGRTWPGNGKAIVDRFMPDGREIGGDTWHCAKLIDAETFARLSFEQRVQEASKAVTDAVGTFRFSDRDGAIKRAKELLALAEAIPARLSENARV